MELIFSALVELAIWLLIELLYRKVISPMLFQTGVAVKWMLFFGRKPFSEIRTENNNRTIGFLVVIVGVAVILLVS